MQSLIQKYDIRGIWNKTLTEDSVKFIAKALSNFILEQNYGKKKSICIACDVRLSSPQIKEILINVIGENGIDVIDLGVLPTPCLYFAMYNAQLFTERHISEPIFGVMITASHNPKEYNGMKMMLNQKCLMGKEIEEILNKNYQNAENIEKSSHGVVWKFDVKNIYIEDIKRILNSAIHKNNNGKVSHQLKIAWDPCNGALCELLKLTLKELNTDCQHFVTNKSPDGNFPNRSPDPEEKNLTVFKKFIIDNECDFGFAFDGDADRLVLVDYDGTIFRGDELLFILALDKSRYIDKLRIVADVKLSQKLFNELKNNGTDVLLSPSGHSIIKQMIKKESDIKLAGEVSGHIFLNDGYYGYDDALFTALYFIQLYKSDYDFVKEIIHKLKTEYRKENSTTKIFCSRNEALKKIKILKTLLTEYGITYNGIDGIRINLGNDFILIRVSNTEEMLMIVTEANDKDTLYKYQKDIYDYFVSNDCNLSTTLKALAKIQKEAE